MGGDIHGRVVITWPPSSTPPTALFAWGCAFDDADTGEQLLDVVAMSIQTGSTDGFDSSGWIEVELTRQVDADGQPIGNGPDAVKRLALTPEYAEWQLYVTQGPHDAAFTGQKFRTGTFRYIVAEMRLAVSEPGVTPRLTASAREGGGGAIPVRVAVITTPGGPAHTHVFTVEPDSDPPFPSGPCSCGMTYAHAEAQRLTREALRYASRGGGAEGVRHTLAPGGEVRTGVPGIANDGSSKPELFVPDGPPRIVSDGEGPAAAIPPDAPTGYVLPASGRELVIPDGT